MMKAKSSGITLLKFERKYLLHLNSIFSENNLKSEDKLSDSD